MPIYKRRPPRRRRRRSPAPARAPARPPATAAGALASPARIGSAENARAAEAEEEYVHRRRKRGTGRRDHPGTTRSLWRTSGESFSSAAYLGKGSFYMPTALFLPPSLPPFPSSPALPLPRPPPAGPRPPIHLAADGGGDCRRVDQSPLAKRRLVLRGPAPDDAADRAAPSTRTWWPRGPLSACMSAAAAAAAVCPCHVRRLPCLLAMLSLSLSC